MDRGNVQYVPGIWRLYNCRNGNGQLPQTVGASMKNTTERIVAHCEKCGGQNPIAAEFCHKCGHQILSLQKSRTNAQDQVVAPPVPQGDSSQGVRQGGYDQKWAAVSGGLIILAGLLVLFAGLADFLASRNIIAQTFFPTSKPVWMISVIVLGLLFTAVGVSILRKIRRTT
jgi:ribosomal protein L40E